MEEHFKKLDQRKESVAIAAGFLLVLAVGLFAIYARQNSITIKPQIASKDE